MSTPTPAPLRTGAYIIRNRQTATVLHTQSADAVTQGVANVQAYQQDESQFKDQQIWWVEPLADYTTDPSKGPVYSITTPGSGKALEANPESGGVYSNQECGGAWQRWRLLPATDAKTGEVFYNIVNVLDGQVLDISITNSQSRAWLSMQTDSPSLVPHQWDFAIPVVGFPPGWFHIQAVGIGHLLSHDYSHNPPALLPPSTRRASQHRSTWQYQWTLCHSKCFTSPTHAERNTWHRTTPPVEPNSWHIINRLTRSPLSHHFGAMNAAEFANRENNLAWKLELDSARNWKLTNRATACLLTREDGGVGCTNQVLTLAGGRQSWILKMLGTSVDNPPFGRRGEQKILRPYRYRHAPRVPLCTNGAMTTVRWSLLLKSTLRSMRGRLRM